MHAHFSYQDRLPTLLRTSRNKPHPKPWPESPAMVIFPFLHKEAQKNLEYPGLYLEYPGNPEYPGLYPENPGFSCPDYPDTYPEYPGTHRTHPTFSCLIALHLPKSNTHMCYMSRLFYHGFAMLKHALSCHLHIITIIHGISIYQVSLHSCRDRDAGARGGWAGDRWRRYFRCESRQAPMHLLHPILDQWSICVLFVHELLYVSLFV